MAAVPRTITLLPRFFARRKDRFELLALSLMLGVTVAFFELMIANVRLDQEPRKAVTTIVIDKMIYKGKNGRYPPQYWHWKFKVEPLPGMNDDTFLRVSRTVWDDAQPGQRIRFHPHPGRLGWVWYSRDEMEEEGFAEVLK